MKIKHLKIQNLKNLINVELSDLPNLVVLIGKNSAGKSNLIDALNLLFAEFGTDRKLDLGDLGDYQHLFPDHDIRPNQPLEITATLLLSIDEWRAFASVDGRAEKYIESVEIDLVRRLVVTENNALWQTYQVHIDGLEVVRDSELIELDTEELNTRLGDVVSDSVSSLSSAEYSDVANSYLSVVSCDEEQMDKLGQLLNDSFQTIHTTSNPPNLSNPFMERPSIINTPQIDDLLKQFQSRGNQRQSLRKITRQYEAMTQYTQRPVAVASSVEIEERDRTVPIGMVGEGNQALLRLVAQVVGNSQVLAIEEPETHLHPTLIKSVSGFLATSANATRQLFVSTHSPFFLDQLPLENIFVVKNDGTGTHVSPMNTTEDHKNLLADIGMRPSDILFSDAILLVEGHADHVFLNRLNHKLGISLMEHRIKIVEASGKSRAHGKIQFWAEVGEDAGIPLYLIFDNDA